MSTINPIAPVLFVPDTTTFALYNIRASRWLDYPAYTKTRAEADHCTRFVAMERYKQLTGGPFANYGLDEPRVPSYELRWFLVAVNDLTTALNFVAEVICTRNELRDQLSMIATCQRGAPLIAVEVFTGGSRAMLPTPNSNIVWSEQTPTQEAV